MPVSPITPTPVPPARIRSSSPCWGRHELAKPARLAAAVDFIEEHKAEIAGIVAGIAVTAGCLVVTGGAGSIGCAALGGAVGAGLTGYMNGQRGWELVGTVALGAAAGALGGAAGALVGRGVGALASRVGTSKLLASVTTRAGQIHRVLDKIAQRNRTTAVLGTAQGRNVLAGGVRDLSPAQRALALPGEVLGRLPGEHAEITALSAAAEAGLTPRAIATTTNICPACRAALEQAGATIVGPRSAIWR